MARDRDFVVLKVDIQESRGRTRRGFASLIMLGVVGSVILLGLPISIAAITGCVLMVITRCLTMEEAYQASTGARSS
jgi:hypothetical protein